MNVNQRFRAAALTVLLGPWGCVIAPGIAAAQANAPTESKPEEGAVAKGAAEPTLADTALADAPPIEAETCISVTDKANAQDMQVTSAQGGKVEPSQLVALNNAATALWTQAIALCEGRARARAQRNLAEDQKLAATLSAQAGAGGQCLSYQKNGAELQELAKKAVAERRWADAAGLFKRSENNWDLASERCSGALQESANQHREQAEVDAFNAEFCGPTFEKARTQTQKFRALPSTSPKEERQAAGMLAESWWRAALPLCKGNVQEIVKNNANTVARERGTPFVAVPLPIEQGASVTSANSAGATATATAVADPSTAPAQVAGVSSNGNKTAVAPVSALVTSSPSANPPAMPSISAAAKPTAASPASAIAPVVAAKESAPIDIRAGDVRYVGKFSRDADSTTYSGTGQLLWDNGASYSGSLVKGKKQGIGRYQWSNGQTYQGEWNADQATGKAEMHFANGNQYVGDVVNGTPEGSGVMRFASGDFYKGTFKNGNPDGKGEYTWKSGQKYVGDWRDGIAVGVGTLRFANGNAYQGEVRDGAPSGQGKLDYASGDSFEGQFTAGQPHGQGTYHWQNGDTYTGDWAMGKKQGQGVFTWQSGQRWEGEFDQDQQTAKGKLIEAGH